MKNVSSYKILMYITPVWAHSILARKAYAGLSQILVEESKARSGKGLEMEESYSEFSCQVQGSSGSSTAHSRYSVYHDLFTHCFFFV